MEEVCLFSCLKFLKRFIRTVDVQLSILCSAVFWAAKLKVLNSSRFGDCGVGRKGKGKKCKRYFKLGGLQ